MCVAKYADAESSITCHAGYQHLAAFLPFAPTQAANASEATITAAALSVGLAAAIPAAALNAGAHLANYATSSASSIGSCIKQWPEHPTALSGAPRLGCSSSRLARLPVLKLPNHRGLSQGGNSWIIGTDLAQLLAAVLNRSAEAALSFAMAVASRFGNAEILLLCQLSQRIVHITPSAVPVLIL